VILSTKKRAALYKSSADAKKLLLQCVEAAETRLINSSQGCLKKCSQGKGGGVLVHRTRCIYYEKCILNPFQNVKKIRKKILSVHLNNLCLPTKFCGQKIIFMVCVKKTKKNGHVNSNVGASKFAFFTEATQKMFFLTKLRE
jgi:hypothetical protein